MCTDSTRQLDAAHLGHKPQLICCASSFASRLLTYISPICLQNDSLIHNSMDQILALFTSTIPYLSDRESWSWIHCPANHCHKLLKRSSFISLGFRRIPSYDDIVTHRLALERTNSLLLQLLTNQFVERTLCMIILVLISFVMFHLLRFLQYVLIFSFLFLYTYVLFAVIMLICTKLHPKSFQSPSLDVCFSRQFPYRTYSVIGCVHRYESTSCSLPAIRHKLQGLNR